MKQKRVILWTKEKTLAGGKNAEMMRTKKKKREHLPRR